MLFRTIDYFFGTNLQNSAIIRNIQNVNTLAMSSFTTISILHYFINSSHSLFPYTLKMVIAHCTIDMLFTPNIDLVFHHIITIRIASLFFYSSFPLDIVHFETMVILSTELSSFFLVGRDWIPKDSPYYRINEYAFLLSFFYFRLYLLPKYLLFGTFVNDFLCELLDHTEKISYYGALYSFMGINVYWAAIMMKVMVKKIRNLYPNSFTYSSNEFFLQYTYYICSTITVIIYNPATELQWFDIVGQLILAYNSGRYHHRMYYIIKKDFPTKESETNMELNVFSPTIRPYYIADLLSIQLRTSLYQLSKFSAFYPNGILGIGGILTLQCIAIYHYYEFVFEMIENKRKLIYGGNSSLMCHMFNMPIFINIILSIIYSNTIVNAHHNLLSLLFIISCMFIKPGYELNHTLLHICLMYQTYSLCIANI
jgi:hypothetical protein